VKGTRREVFLAEDPEGYVERLWRLASLSMWEPFGGNWEGSSTGDFERRGWGFSL